MSGDPRPVVLVSLDWDRPVDGRRNLGGASIAAALHVAGVPCTWLDEAVNTPEFDLSAFTERVLDAVRQAGARVLVGIGCYVWNESAVQVLLHALARFGNPEVVLGGPQVSYAKPGVLVDYYPTVKWFVRGYGEHAMVALAMGTASHGQAGLVDARGDDWGRRFDGEIDDLPSPYTTGVLQPGARVRWETQRGCPFRCTFCQHREPDARHRLRTMGEGRVAEDLSLFAARGVRRISVLDPIFHARRDHATRVLHLAREVGLTAQLALQCRFELVTPEFLDALAGLAVTLEFGLQTTSVEEGQIIERRNDLAKVERSLALLLDRGIDFEVSLIYGLPQQTLVSFEASVEWCLERRVPRLVAWPLMLLRGTALADQKERWGMVESKDPIPLVIASRTFSEHDHHAMGDVADWLRAHPGARRLPGRLDLPGAA